MRSKVAIVYTRDACNRDICEVVSGEERLFQQSGEERLFQQSGEVKFLQELMLWTDNAQHSISYEKKRQSKKFDVLLKKFSNTLIHKLDATM